jgi:hypothetical protein
MYTSDRLFAILVIATSAVYPSLTSPLTCILVPTSVPINATPTNLLVLVAFAATLTLFKLAVTLQNPLAMKMENHAAAGNSA